jgi:secreted trypsin-like serine protease
LDDEKESFMLFFLLMHLFFSSSSQAAVRPIIGGEQVIKSDVISRITAGLVSTSVAGQALCTVSLVADDLAVTAAHCVRVAPGEPRAVLTLIFGRDLHSPENPKRIVDQAEIPDGAADVALLHFEGGLPVDYQFAKLLPFDQELKEGDPVTLAGFGIWSAERNDGEGFLRKAQVTVSNPHYSSTEIEFDQSLGRGACHGDSGGPAYFLINKKPYLFGITSRGGGNCDQRVIYSTIGSLADWFKEAGQAMRAKSVH